MWVGQNFIQTGLKKIFVPNSTAHGLAKNVIRIFMDNVWLEEPPSCIYDIVIL
jgi:hypothetical protein